MKATPRAKRYYGTLGLSCDASAKEIREAYYQLAFTHHPDRNPGDASAAVRFKEIQVAYEWLSQRRVASPPPTSEQFPFHAPQRSQAGLVWKGLAALAAVAGLSVTLTMLLRTTPRTGEAIETESHRLEQLTDPSHFATKLEQPVNNTLQRSAAGRPEWLAESSARSWLESEEWIFFGSFTSALNTALDAVLSGSSSSGSFTEDWHAIPSWQGTTKLELPLDPMSIRWLVLDSATQPTPEENDQQVLFEGGVIRFGNRRREPESLELEFAFSAPEPAARQLEPVNDIPGKWNGEPQSPLLQQPQPIEHTMPRSYTSGKSDDALQQPKSNRHSLSSEVLSSTTIPSYRGHSNQTLLNPLERFSSTVSSDTRRPSPLLPNQPKGSPARQEEKLLGHWPWHEPQQKRQSTDRAQSPVPAEASTWGTNSRQKAWPQSGIATGNAWGSVGSFTQNSIPGVKGDFRLSGRGGTMANLGGNSQQVSATSSNYAGLLTRPEERMDKSYLSPESNKAGVFRGSYLDPPAAPDHRGSVPAMAPFDNGIRTNYAERERVARPFSGQQPLPYKLLPEGMP